MTISFTRNSEHVYTKVMLSRLGFHSARHEPIKLIDTPRHHLNIFFFIPNINTHLSLPDRGRRSTAFGSLITQEVLKRSLEMILSI